MSDDLDKNDGSKFYGTDFLLKRKENGLDNINFIVYGSYESLHDSISGIEGSFFTLERSLDECRKFRMKINIEIIVKENNYHDLPKIVRFITKYYPNTVTFIPSKVEYFKIMKKINRSIILLEDYNIINSNEQLEIIIKGIPRYYFQILGFEKYVK